MNNRSPRILVYTFVFSVLDLALTIFGLCWHGQTPSLSLFTDQFSNYTFLESTLDFLFISLLRVAFLTSGCLLLFTKKEPANLLQILSHGKREGRVFIESDV